MMTESQGQRPARVLVVDDDPAILRLLEFQLSRVGYSVVVAYKDSVALERARAFDPDAILLDLNLPDGSMTEVMDQLRGGRDRRRVIVILSDRPHHGQTLRLHGADLIESKPIAPSTLVQRLENLQVPPRVEDNFMTQVAIHAR